FVFFFSSRRRHTRFSRDWSSDVCSSDLHGCLNVIHGKIQYGKGGRRVVRFGIDEHVAPAAYMQRQRPVFFGHIVYGHSGYFQAKSSAVKGPGLFKVINGKCAESLVEFQFEHEITSLVSAYAAPAP